MNRFLESHAAPLRATILLGTLKPRRQLSNTATLCDVLLGELSHFGVKTKIVRLVEYNIKPGLKNDMGTGDEWPGILEDVLASDILIFATPIWWGIQSSLVQRVIERMDELNDELLKTGKSEFSNKIGGIIITGAEDGAEHTIGNLCNFMVWNGLTLPPACSLSFLGPIRNRTREGLLKKFKTNKATASAARTMARNLVFFARLLKENNIPEGNKEAKTEA